MINYCLSAIQISLVELNQFLYCFREDINRAYKKLAAILHPNKNVAPGSAEAFKVLVKACTVLLHNK